MTTGSRGFSLIELMLVCAVFAILAGITIPISRGFIARSELDSSSIVVTSAIEAARNRAIAERRNFQLTFTAPNQLRVDRAEVPGPATTTVENLTFENDLIYLNFASMGDTDDQFAPGVAAIQFTGTPPVMFTSDGSLIDSNGDVVNGTIFLGRENQPETARAISIFGVTGLIRNWEWVGTRWQQ